MPVINGFDSIGSFYQFGQHGHKYYYNPHSERSRLRARSKAVKQGRAIKFSQNRRIIH